MPRPTEWRELQAGRRHQDTHAGKEEHYEGPACYELGITRNSLTPRLVYVGKADDICRRLHSHSLGTSNIGDEVRRAMKNDFKVWFRFFKVETGKDAELFERKMLRKWWKYFWNTQNIYSKFE